jgi:hypothetical protein
LGVSDLQGVPLSCLGVAIATPPLMYFHVQTHEVANTRVLQSFEEQESWLVFRKTADPLGFLVLVSTRPIAGNVSSFGLGLSLARNILLGF